MNKFFLLLLVGAIGATAFVLTQPVPQTQDARLDRSSPAPAEPVQIAPAAPAPVIETDDAAGGMPPIATEPPIESSGTVDVETGVEIESPASTIDEPTLPLDNAMPEKPQQPIGDEQLPAFPPPELEELNTAVPPTLPGDPAMPDMPAVPADPAPAQTIGVPAVNDSVDAEAPPVPAVVDE